MKKLLLLTSLMASLAFPNNSNAQSDSTERLHELIQFTGILITPDSLQAVSDVNIRIAGTMMGTVSNDEGFFAIVAKRNDTLIFSSVGFRTVKYVVPYSLTGQKYTMIQPMSQDTLYLPEAIVKPYISRELFEHYFVNLEVPQDGNPLENMDPETIRELAYAMSMDGQDNAKYYLRQEAGKYYYTGQMVPINLMNPFAWAQFIKSWKDGKLKIQKD
ncbi:MAG: carboxypeptidase-like regulatory domain-containing protein [Bacteroidota bacterium]|nr:carboxypeptidase-like regulatory domain-containing protein [Bacteroidota bacterium]MDX5430665.1 carboxypeptidase-like regulatory domain-containing protein [Bacteroidota bacterium]MDX5469412.1 carboxypeptidase-like regulatory domain-containing protein [Bacteroidota bacterium]